jgi:hypothetical protein
VFEQEAVLCFRVAQHFALHEDRPVAVIEAATGTINRRTKRKETADEKRIKLTASRRVAELPASHQYLRSVTRRSDLRLQLTNAFEIWYRCRYGHKSARNFPLHLSKDWPAANTETKCRGGGEKSDCSTFRREITASSPAPRSSRKRCTSSMSTASRHDHCQLASILLELYPEPRFSSGCLFAHYE